MDNPSFVVANLNFEHAGTRALDAVSLTLPAHCLTAIVGCNGSGKTTLLRLLAGLERPHSGSVHLAPDQEPHTLPIAKRAQLISWLSSRSEVPFDYSVRDIVTMGRYPWHLGFPTVADRDRVTSVLDELGLIGLADRGAASLSSGQLQRVMIARMLATDTRVRLFDEPTTYLDQRAKHTTMQTLAALGRDGATVICALNDINLASRFADYVVFLKDGRLLAAGPKVSVLSESNISEAFDIEARSIDCDGFRYFYHA